jgi:hypothetical protein
MNETQRKIRAEFLAAADLPPLPRGVRLAAGLTMDGFRLPPEDVIDRLLGAGEGLGEALGRVGFARYEHHVRDCDHETWQSFELGLVERRTAARTGEPCWCIPREEILCVALGDWEALGFESDTRYLYVGSELEFRAALERACELAAGRGVT